MLISNGVCYRVVPLYVLQTGMMLTELFQTSTQPLQTSLVAGVSAALGVLLVVVIVVVIVIIVMVMRRRNKDYALQQSTEGPGFMNAMYSGRWTM